MRDKEKKKTKESAMASPPVTEGKLGTGRRAGKELWLLVCYPVGILCLILARTNSVIAEEVFAKRIFRAFSQAVAAVTGLLPFSLAEFCLVVGIPVLLIFLVYQLFCLLQRKNRSLKRFLAGLGYGGKVAVLAGGVLFLWYVLGCGVNYYRYPFSHYAGLEVKEASVEELYNLCLELADHANDAREALGSANEDEKGVYRYDGEIRKLGAAARQAYSELGKQYPILSGSYPAPKPVFLSKLMSRTEITGIFIPFTMEANINTDIPDYSIPSTMCHELAHLHGFIREDEANYISYLICVNSGQPELIYSGYMEALILSANALYAKSPELYSQVRELYSEEVVRDLADNSLYWKQFENTMISKIADKVNDTYLKLNQQKDGVFSYGRMVDLLLAEYRKKHSVS